MSFGEAYDRESAAFRAARKADWSVKEMWEWSEAREELCGVWDHWSCTLAPDTMPNMVLGLCRDGTRQIIRANAGVRL